MTATAPRGPGRGHSLGAGKRWRPGDNFNSLEMSPSHGGVHLYHMHAVCKATCEKDECMITRIHRLLILAVVTIGVVLCGAIGRGIAIEARTDPTGEPTGGSVLGMDQRRVVCTNLITKQSVVIRDGAKSWNCEDAGLVVRPGDRIRQTVEGTATSTPTYEPTCPPALEDPYNCRLDQGRLCQNITRNDYPTKEACLANLCDVFGPQNAQAGFSSWCVYNGKRVKAYTTHGIYPAGDFCATGTLVPYDELKVYHSDGVSSYCEYAGRLCPGSGAPTGWELPLGMIFTGPCP
jgi:hypothetical protein